MFYDVPVQKCKNATSGTHVLGLACYPFGKSDPSRSSLPPEVPSGEQQLRAFPASFRSLWRQDALETQPQILQRTTGWDGCSPFLSEGMRCITWNTRGLVGSVFSRQRNREFKLKFLKRLLDNNNICLQEVHGKDEFLQAIQVLAPRFRLFGTFLHDSENVGGSAICIHRDLLPEEAIVSHVITCQGRDHFVNIQSGRHNLVIVNVHFEPELTLRQLRGRLRLIHPHWPVYPSGVGIILGDFNICDPEEGRFNVWNQSFTDGDLGKTAVFHSFFPHVLEVAQLDYTRRDATALGAIRTLSRIDRIFIIYPWLNHEISIVILMSLRTSGRKLFRVTTLQYAQIEDTRANVLPAGCPNIPFFVPYCSNFMTTTGSLLTHLLCAFAEFKVLLHKAKKMTKRELSRQTPDCIGAKLSITSTALRAYRNRHLGTLIRCCEAWKLVEDCFDTLSFECIDIHRLSQIIASLTRENLEARESEVSTLP